MGARGDPLGAARRRAVPGMELRPGRGSPRGCGLGPCAGTAGAARQPLRRDPAVGPSAARGRSAAGGTRSSATPPRGAGNAGGRSAWWSRGRPESRGQRERWPLRVPRPTPAVPSFCVCLWGDPTARHLGSPVVRRAEGAGREGGAEPYGCGSCGPERPRGRGRRNGGRGGCRVGERRFRRALRVEPLRPARGSERFGALRTSPGARQMVAKLCRSASPPNGAPGGEIRALSGARAAAGSRDGPSERSGRRAAGRREGHSGQRAAVRFGKICCLHGSSPWPSVPLGGAWSVPRGVTPCLGAIAQGK
ncbi:translation initiation factor IF-2-like isoform X3 [Gallus gallus]|uniref:translation initiation factor IF-2-like isoform X3 n=1 Tax=Gallus gallus TaxID=9031 RepID=UPI001F016210|nr:translation initiation factor IF-2-like isoform X3 [Gallus gallus]